MSDINLKMLELVEFFSRNNFRPPDIEVNSVERAALMFEEVD